MKRLIKIKNQLSQRWKVNDSFTKLKLRQLRAVILILLAIFAFTTWIAQARDTSLSNEDFIRFHVIANSNSQEDQALKLLVRDQVLDKVNQDLVAQVMASGDSVTTQGNPGIGEKETMTMDLESTREYIIAHLDEIEAVAEQCVIDHGYSYPVDAQLGVRWIPKKTYGNVTFPAGNYEALNLVIGQGDGQNWWCVLFPPLCLIDGDPEDSASSKEELARDQLYRDALLDQKYGPLLEAQEKATTLKLKFKTLELVKKGL